MAGSPVVLFDDLIEKNGLTVTAGYTMAYEIENALYPWGPLRAVCSREPADLTTGLTGYFKFTITGEFTLRSLSVLGINALAGDGDPDYAFEIKVYPEGETTGPRLLELYHTLRRTSNLRPKNLYCIRQTPIAITTGIDVYLKWFIDPSVNGNYYSFARIFLSDTYVFPECLSLTQRLTVSEQKTVGVTAGEQTHGPTSRRKRGYSGEFTNISQERMFDTFLELPSGSTAFVDLAHALGQTEEAVLIPNVEAGSFYAGDGDLQQAEAHSTGMYGHFEGPISCQLEKDSTWTAGFNFVEALT